MEKRLKWAAFLILAKMEPQSIEQYLNESLQSRIAKNSLRVLKPQNSLVDFCSNDYLGFARSGELRSLFLEELKKYPDFRSGSGGSRLLAGNDQFTEDLEAKIAAFHQAEAALIFNSGYDANIGLFSSLAQRGDTIITDELVHASIIDGVRLSHANRYIFKHNDIASLEAKLEIALKTGGKVFIAVESIYSMDGDEAPLKEISSLANKYGASLIVDEAHAIGIFGFQGRGLVYDLGLTNQVFARVVTFGKALGIHGASVLGSSSLRSYLINFARSFIYTTASPFPVHLAIKMAYRYLQSRDHQTEINNRIQCFREELTRSERLLESRSAIQVIRILGNREVKDAASLLQDAGFDVRPILGPTVKEGAERLRICLHTHNTMEEIRALAQLIKQLP